MSNDMVSQQLSLSANQIAQLQSISSQLEQPVPMQFLGLQTTEALQQQISSSGMSEGQMGTMSNDPRSHLSISNQQRGPPAIKMDSRHYMVHSNPIGDMGTIYHSMQPQQLSALSKRKTPMEPWSSDHLPNKSLMPNKRVAQAEHRPWLQPISTPSNITVQVQSASNSPRSQPSALNKKPVPSKFNSSASKVKPVSMGASPKGQSESSESVRSKMRESLAAALALVSQEKGDSSSYDKNSPGQATSSSGMTSKDSSQVEPTSGRAGFESAKLQEALPINENVTALGNLSDAPQKIKCEDEQFQSVNILAEEDAPLGETIFANDELLQGNGLSWVLEPKLEIVEEKEAQIIQKNNSDVKMVNTESTHQPLRTPKIMAFKIEAELFKLFGAVNKKYKEKGRSLLFNLKDRNNPELRERVMSGDIPPERLCSMSAEELASRELSQWRQAKAEELAQMVVLPDTEVDPRRLVRKTHKGEFQVEVEEDDGASVEVSAVATRLTCNPKTEMKEPTSQMVGKKDEGNTADEKNDLEERNVSSTITIPSAEGIDPMQGLMVEDELKDTEFLPPIVSLDEFMQSLDSEPPFQNLPGDSRRLAPMSEKDDSKAQLEAKSLEKSSKDSVDGSPDKSHHADKHNSNYDGKPGVTPAGTEATDSVAMRSEQVWEGSLHLNAVVVPSVIGVYKSGEKTSTKEWPSFLEIKGRVKLEAFEKFLQELPLSRSRTVMVVHFVSKEASPKTKSLSEVAVSYASDGRVGFAEPASGMELYFCPPHSKTLDLFDKILSKDQLEALKAIDNGLIGVVVWRRAQLISPSRHKHNPKKQHSTSSNRRRQEMNSSNLASKPAPSKAAYSKPPSAAADDEGDVPPGFGPGSASRDEDDLPEFNFSGGLNPSSKANPYSTRFSSQGSGTHSPHLNARPQSSPVDQIRQLIHKYGQPSGGIPSTTWNDDDNDDDDDDIPEWQPQVAAPSPSVNSFQQQIHGTQQQQVAHQMMQSQSGSAQPRQQAPGWVAPLDPRTQHVSGSQFYGAPSWPMGVPKSRGF